MSTFSQSSTYTIADVAKVVDRFAADLHMVAQSTGLMSTAKAKDYAADVKVLAQRGYIYRVDIVLSDVSGNIIKAASYTTSTDASGWTSDRPGNSLWPRTPGGTLDVLIFRSAEWLALTSGQQCAFESTYCNIGWSPSDIDASYPGLVGSYDRRYSSNAFGMERTLYEGGF